ncbi:MAG TPA: hypothetical protein VIF61_02240, partial [Methylocystis sp.]
RQSSVGRGKFRRVTATRCPTLESIESRVPSPRLSLDLARHPKKNDEGYHPSIQFLNPLSS